MWSRDKKSKEKTFSFSKTTTKVFTSTTVDGREVEMGADLNLSDLEAQLKATGMSEQMINQALSALQNQQQSTEVEANAHAQVKVTCGDCSRTVAYSKGNCMYCGSPLQLPEENLTTAQSIDKEILNGEQAEVEQNTSETAFINRLKDL